jgi:hypothetical protein
MRSDLSEVKSGVRGFRDKMDVMSAKLSERIDNVSTKVESVKDSIAAAKIWALVLYITLAAGMLTTIARGSNGFDSLKKRRDGESAGRDAAASVGA